MTTSAQPSAGLTRFVVASRFLPVYIALALLVTFAAIFVPEMIGSVPLRAVARYGGVLAIAALGQMLVVMTAGIDLSTPATMSMAGVIMVGVSHGSDERIWIAVAVALAAGAAIGLFNGLLIGGLNLNALIVTLATWQIGTGLIRRYVNGKWPWKTPFAAQNPVPERLGDLVDARILGLSAVFWLALLLTIVVSLVLRYTTVGRRFQAVGANPVASSIAGVRVNLNQILVYVVAGVFYAIAGIALAGLIGRPGVGVGTDYLLAPIAAVVIGGASLTGGLASPFATFAAAFFLEGLDQTMLTMGLPTSMQFVVFGLVIVGGMLISGDRITKGVEQLLRERRRPTRSEVEEILTPMNE